MGSWVDKDGNHIEMGLHVFFGCYYNFFGIFRRLGIFDTALRLKSHTHQFVNKVRLHLAWALPSAPTVVVLLQSGGPLNVSPARWTASPPRRQLGLVCDLIHQMPICDRPFSICAPFAKKPPHYG